MSDQKDLREKIAAVRDEVAEIEAKASLLGTALRLANKRAEAAEAREAELRGALGALGVIGDGYCFCSRDRDPDKAEHEPECRDACGALASGEDDQ